MSSKPLWRSPSFAYLLGRDRGPSLDGAPVNGLKDSLLEASVYKEKALLIGYYFPPRGEARGKMQIISGIETYVSAPASDKANGNIVLYFPDVYGLFNNALLIMDAFADAGYLALGLDYFKGDPVTKYRKDRHDTSNPNFNFEAWLAKHTKSADEIVPGWVSEVKSTFGKAGTKYACTGYCFGAPYVCDELAGDTVAVGAFAHPAFLKDHHFRNLKKPLLLSCAEVDHTFGTESRNKAINILIEDKKPYQLQLFSGVEHGFALRCDLSKPYARYVKEQSLKGMIEWFDFWLSQPHPVNKL